MKFSIWNQHWEHKEIINLSPEQAYKRLLEHYMQSSKSFTLDKESFSRGFSFNRGNVLVSALCLGSELWCKHYVDIEIQEIEEGKVQIDWKRLEIVWCTSWEKRDYRRMQKGRQENSIISATMNGHESARQVKAKTLAEKKKNEQNVSLC